MFLGWILWTLGGSVTERSCWLSHRETERQCFLKKSGKSQRSHTSGFKVRVHQNVRNQWKCHRVWEYCITAKPDLNQHSCLDRSLCLMTSVWFNPLQSNSVEDSSVLFSFSLIQSNLGHSATTLAHLLKSKELRKKIPTHWSTSRVKNLLQRPFKFSYVQNHPNLFSLLL